MRTYQYCALKLASDIEIPELPEWASDGPGLTFRLESDKQLVINHLRAHPWPSLDGKNVPLYANLGSHHWLRFPALADFRISAEATEISCYSTSEVPVETIRHLLLDQVLPCCLAFHGKVMLHASGVQLEQGVLLFIGDSGAGKSTLAGDFHQAGQPALADDCLWIRESKGQVVAVPSYSGLRLWDDSLSALFEPELATQAMAHYSSKQRVPLSRHDLPQFGPGLPIVAVIVLSKLEQPSDVNLERLSRREIFIALMKQSFLLNGLDLCKFEQHVRRLGRIAPKLPSFRLSMPHDYRLLPIVRERIMNAVL